MSNDSTAVDFGINLFEQEIDDVIFRTNEFLTDATFTGGQGPFWWLLGVGFFFNLQPSVNQLFGILSHGTNFRRGAKMGQKQEKCRSKAFPNHPRFSKTSAFGCKGTHLSRKRRGIRHKSLYLMPFLTPHAPPKVVSDISKSEKQKYHVFDENTLFAECDMVKQY